jgi:signal transduction histidine kinase
MEAFGYTVSHDLRAPLRAIGTLADFTLRDERALSPEGRQNLESIRASAASASNLVESLLRFSRASAGDLRDDQVDLGALAREIAAALAAQNPARDVQFALVQPERLGVRGDKDLLRVALENLLGNAWKYTAEVPHARVEFGLASEDEDVRTFFVRDNGAGFDAARHDQLFVPFRRLHAGTGFAGTGIGLATVRRIIERHGGRVWAESRPGEGATFYFTLGPDDAPA